MWTSWFFAQMLPVLIEKGEDDMVSFPNFLSSWHKKHKFQGFIQSGSMEWNWISVTSSFTNLEIRKLSGFLQKRMLLLPGSLTWKCTTPKNASKWCIFARKQWDLQILIFNHAYAKQTTRLWLKMILSLFFPIAKISGAPILWVKILATFKEKDTKRDNRFWVVSNHPFWRKSLVLSLEPLGVVEKPSLFSEGPNHGTFPQLWAASTPFLPYQSLESGHFDLRVWGWCFFGRKITK